jgi:Zn-dependent protease
MMDITVADLICRALILIIVFPAHELAHAVAATRMGDPTPRLAGRLTLNPFKHLSAFGSLLFLLAGIGWASTPINPAYFGENVRRKMGLVAVVGPLTNLALACLGIVPFYLFGWLPTLTLASQYLPTPAYFFTLFVVLNLLLAFFNLIPIAPLDGAQVLGAFLSGPVLKAYDSIQRFGSYILLVAVFILPQMGFDPIALLFQYAVAPIFQFLISGLG